MVFNEVALTGWYCAVPGIMVQFVKVFTAFGTEIKWPCKYTKTDIKLPSVHKHNEASAQRTCLLTC